MDFSKGKEETEEEMPKALELRSIGDDIHSLRDKVNYYFGELIGLNNEEDINEIKTKINKLAGNLMCFGVAIDSLKRKYTKTAISREAEATEILRESQYLQTKLKETEKQNQKLNDTIENMKEKEIGLRNEIEENHLNIKALQQELEKSKHRLQEVEIMEVQPEQYIAENQKSSEELPETKDMEVIEPNKSEKKKLKKERQRKRKVELEENKETDVKTTQITGEKEELGKKQTNKAGTKMNDEEESEEMPYAEINAIKAKVNHRPIIIKSIDKWKTLQRGIVSRQLKYSRATVAKNGYSMKIIPETEDDYAHIVKYLEEMEKIDENIKWITLNNSEDRPHKMVMKGIPYNFAPEEIKQDLEEQQIKIIKVTNMTSKKEDRRPLSMFLITLPKTEDDKILNVKECLGLRVRIERMKERACRVQCYKCQGYDHAQSTCHAGVKCVACGGEHRATDCPRPKEERASCANCGGPHPANYRFCPRRPMERTTQAEKRQKESGRTYAQATKNETSRIDLKQVCDALTEMMEQLGQTMKCMMDTVHKSQ